MTFEHRLLANLQEIKAIVFECNQCKARIAVVPEVVEGIPRRCPNGHPWNEGLPRENSNSAFLDFVALLKIFRHDEISEKSGFTIFLEFDEPKTNAR